jgi:transcriptional regulator with XRE-family HTH domain
MRTPEQVVGAQVRDRRLSLGLSQEAVANAMRVLGFNWLQTTVAKTEAADRPLRVNEVGALARVLDLTISDLLAFAAAPEEVSAATSQLQNALDGIERCRRGIAELERDIQHYELLRREAERRLEVAGVASGDH